MLFRSLLMYLSTLPHSPVVSLCCAGVTLSEQQLLPRCHGHSGGEHLRSKRVTRNLHKPVTAATPAKSLSSTLSLPASCQVGPPVLIPVWSPQTPPAQRGPETGSVTPASGFAEACVVCQCGDAHRLNRETQTCG